MTAINKSVPERVEEIADAIDRAYEGERDRFDRGFRKQMTKNTLTTALTETDQQARETEREKIANELVDILPVGTVDAFAILKAIEAYQKVLRTPNPPSQV